MKYKENDKVQRQRKSFRTILLLISYLIPALKNVLSIIQKVLKIDEFKIEGSILSAKCVREEICFYVFLNS